MAEKKGKENLSKSAAFIKLVNKRVPKAKRALELVGNLFSDNYEYTADQAKVVLAHIDAAVTKLKARAANPGKEEATEKIF